MEQSRSVEEQIAKLLAFVNYEMGRSFVGWKTGKNLQENTEKLSGFTELAQKAGMGFAITVKENAAFGEHPSSFTDEAVKHLKQDEDNELVFTIPGTGEQKNSEDQALTIEINDKYLKLNSANGAEATFNRTDVLFFTPR